MPCIIVAIAIYARFYLEIEEKSYEKISQTAAFVAFVLWHCRWFGFDLVTNLAIFYK